MDTVCVAYNSMVPVGHASWVVAVRCTLTWAPNARELSTVAVYLKVVHHVTSLDGDPCDRCPSALCTGDLDASRILPRLHFLRKVLTGSSLWTKLFVEHKMTFDATN
jgi:hypothetical protein